MPTLPLDTTPSALRQFARSPLTRAFILGVLALFLEIPVLFIASLVEEHNQTRDEAIAEMTSHWGGSQRLAGPFLVIPYRYQVTEVLEGLGERTRWVDGAATFLPTELSADVSLATERRRRGIFEAPVYRSTAQLTGAFDPPDFTQWDIAPDQILWDRAQVAFDLSDVHAIQTGARIEWAGDQLTFEPGAGLRASDRSGIHAPLANLEPGRQWSFSFSLEFNGSSRIDIAPVGAVTTVSITGDWPDPSFQGAWLPTNRDVAADAFSAEWNIPHLGRNFPQSWRQGTKSEEIDASMFGVDLLSPVDPYRQTIRSLKYSLLFFTLTFVTAWLFEVLGGARLHPIHYALIGAAMCLFYLLELALSEHIGFASAYSIAAAAVVVVNTGYAWSILASPSRAGILAGALVGLYTFLYVLLQIQDYALLIGAIGIFVVLAGIMYATRHVNWHSPTAPEPRA